MLQLMKEKLAKLWVDIDVAMQRRYAYLTDEVMRPEGGPPATESELDGLERHWGFPLPVSYRALMSLHNGARNFCYKAPLLPVHDVIHPPYEWYVVEDIDRDLVRTVFVGGDYDMFFAFDHRVPPRDGELEVVILNSDGSQERHPNLLVFMEKYLDALRAAADREEADRAGVR